MNQLNTEHGGCLKEGIIDFSSNVNPLGVSSKVIKIIKSNLHKINLYPDPESKKLIKAISKFYDIEPENIVIGNGANELLYSIIFALLPRKAVLISPTFSEYERALNNIKCEIDYFPLDEKDNFFVNLSKLNKKMKNADILFLCNPNNPTGNVVSKDKLLKFVYNLQWQRKFIVVDESFINFIEEQSVIKQAQGIFNIGLIVVRSFTKYFGLAGLRLGFAVANKVVI
ncbi:MAG: pyridoxal phosphate-dependent aminotransferase, partial [Endomicrobiia bacterium]